MRALTIKSNILILRFLFRSYIWVFVPLAIFGGIRSCSTYNEAGKHLTKKSVSVSGYYRKDGTYVSSYNRRPPGSVKRDAPYESTRFFMGASFLACLGVAILYPFFTIDSLNHKMYIRKNRVKDLIMRRQSIHKKIAGFNIAVKLIEFDTFSELPIKPNNLKFSNSGSFCKFDHSNVNRTNFNIRYKAKVNYYYVCLEHLSTLDRIGQGQPSSNYQNEIDFYKQYKPLYKEFKNRFNQCIIGTTLEFSDHEIQNYFYNLYESTVVNSK